MRHGKRQADRVVADLVSAGDAAVRVQEKSASEDEAGGDADAGRKRQLRRGWIKVLHQETLAPVFVCVVVTVIECIMRQAALVDCSPFAW